jgi:hypothetical protein
LFASKSAISCKVAFLLTLACIIVRGFTKLFLSLGIEGKEDRAILYYYRVLKLIKG